MSKTNVDWADKYLLPTGFGDTNLAEVYGVIMGEEMAEGAWYVSDALYNDNQEKENINAAIS